MPKHYLLILGIFHFVSINTYSQLDLTKMVNINLGEVFPISKPYIKSMFTQKPSIMKADFLGAYRVNYNSVPFNYYGDADYTFQYVKDSLVSIKVSFTFEATDTAQFRRLYKTLINDLKNDPSKDLLEQYSDLNEQKVFSYIMAHCRTTAPKGDINYKEVEKKFLGQNFWAIYDNEIYTGKFLRFYVNLSEIHSVVQENGNISTYDGAAVVATLEMTNEHFQDLKSLEEDLEVSNYKGLDDNSTPVKLKFKNGVFFVPVSINSTLNIDFVLDPGASDVSISPDIFLVLLRAGTIQDNDYIGSQNYQFADGTTAKSSTFNIRSIQIGEIIIQNVRASISNSLSAPLLLGQSALKKLKSYRIDNQENLLIME